MRAIDDLQAHRTEEIKNVLVPLLRDLEHGPKKEDETCSSNELFDPRVKRDFEDD
jgi:hypothetical protein